MISCLLIKHFEETKKRDAREQRYITSHNTYTTVVSRVISTLKQMWICVTIIQAPHYALEKLPEIDNNPCYTFLCVVDLHQIFHSVGMRLLIG
jgi:hypothetical protein